jgi:hypothetical protein
MKYTKYLSLVSLPQFQSELFTLQLCNMQMKFRMLESAGWQLRNKTSAELLATQIKPEHIYDAIDQTRNGTFGAQTWSNAGLIFRGAIDAICRNIPHTNETTKQARRHIETMQHHFGCPMFFLTVAPDDDNHILVQIYSEEILSTIGATDRMNDGGVCIVQ